MLASNPLLRFLLLCVLYWALALAAISFFPGIEATAIEITLATLQASFGAAGIEVTRLGDTLVAGGAGVRIVADCSPHMPWLLFTGAVLAFPAPWSRRLAGLVAGIVAIHVFNVMRIAGLIGVLIRWPRWFDFAHVYLWQTGTVFMIVLCFLVWLRWASPLRPRPA
jgi:exosortase/archaeosortase family protein